jgi:transposase-like protein
MGMKRYKTEFKLEVVKSFLADDEGVKLLARRRSMSESKMSPWVSHDGQHGIEGLRPKQSAARRMCLITSTTPTTNESSCAFSDLARQQIG